MNSSNSLVRRRGFLKGIGTAAAGVLWDGAGVCAFRGQCAESVPANPFPCIDTHIHIYDPARPQGVPWPPKELPLLYSTHLPAQFVKLTEPLGVAGAVVVEASPWVEDNQWVLDVAKDNPVIVGLIGNLELGKPEFAGWLKRFAANPLFRGLRLRGVPIPTGAGEAAFTDDLKRLADRQLTVDVVGDTGVLSDVLRVKKMVPDLRVVIDHLPFREWNKDNVPKMREALKEVARLPKVYVKISDVPRKVDDRLVESPQYYRPVLDALWSMFGPDRAIYGSNWPVSDLVAPYGSMFRIVSDYFAGKSDSERQKFFWKNSLAAYSWVPRGKARALVAR
jgi:L-fuconolactonase